LKPTANSKRKFAENKPVRQHFLLNETRYLTLCLQQERVNVVSLNNLAGENEPKIDPRLQIEERHRKVAEQRQMREASQAKAREDRAARYVMFLISSRT
jgi:hypothetical protein